MGVFISSWMGELLALLDTVLSSRKRTGVFLVSKGDSSDLEDNWKVPPFVVRNCSKPSDRYYPLFSTT